MGKGKGGSSDRAAKVAKAGKRSGNTVYPAPISSERRAGKEQGEQQFVSNKPLSVEREGTVIVFNQKTGRYEYKTRTVTVSAEYVFDPTRGRIVYTPSFKEKEAKR